MLVSLHSSIIRPAARAGLKWGFVKIRWHGVPNDGDMLTCILWFDVLNLSWFSERWVERHAQSSSVLRRIKSLKQKRSNLWKERTQKDLKWWLGSLLWKTNTKLRNSLQDFIIALLRKHAFINNPTKDKKIATHPKPTFLCVNFPRNYISHAKKVILLSHA